MYIIMRIKAEGGASALKHVNNFTRRRGGPAAHARGQTGKMAASNGGGMEVDATGEKITR